MLSKILYPNTSREWAFTPHRARRAGAGKWLEGWEVGKTRPDGGLPAVCGRTPSPRQAAPSKARPACGAWAHEWGGVGADCPLAGWGCASDFFHFARAAAFAVQTAAFIAPAAAAPQAQSARRLAGGERHWEGKARRHGCKTRFFKFGALPLVRLWAVEQALSSSAVGLPWRSAARLSRWVQAGYPQFFPDLIAPFAALTGAVGLLPIW